MSARRLTGEALAAALGKAAEAAIAGAVKNGADRLQQALTGVDEGRDAPSPPLWGRVGEGGLASPRPEGEVGPQGRERVYGLSAENPGQARSGAFPKPSPVALRASTSPAGRGEGKRITLTLSGPNLFAREFGSLAVPADPVIAPAIRAQKRRSR